MEGERKIGGYITRIPQYGNKLQNYALKEVLNEQGFEVDTMVLYEERDYLYTIVRNIKRLFHTTFEITFKGHQQI